MREQGSFGFKGEPPVVLHEHEYFVHRALEADLLHHAADLAVNALDLIQADLVDLRGGEVGSRVSANEEWIPALPLGRAARPEDSRVSGM